MTSRRNFLSKLNPFSGLSRCETEPAEKTADLAISRRIWLAGTLSATAFAALPGCASFTDWYLQPSIQSLPINAKPENIRKGPFYTIVFNENSKNSPEVPKHINFIYFFVLNDGEIKPLILSSEDLARNPSLKIDGYVVDIMAFGEKEMDIAYGKTKTKKIKGVGEWFFREYGSIDKGITGDLIEFDALGNDEYPGSVFESLLKRAKSDQNDKLLGIYCLANTFLKNGRPISFDQYDNLQIEMEDAIYSIPIEQNRIQVFKKIGNVTFYYEGNNLNRLTEVEDLEKKIRVIYDAIINVGRLFGDDSISKVVIKGVNHKYASVVNGELIFFSLGCFKLLNAQTIKGVTEHELIHTITTRNGFNNSVRLRNIFADIKEYDEGERYDVIKKGGYPFYKYYDGETAFFEFINESNFLAAGDGGHSYKNIFEFNTSFIHSLVYIERMEENLNNGEYSFKKDEVDKKDGHLNASDHIKRKLTHAEKIRILTHYITIITAMIEEIDIFGCLYDSKLEKFLREKLEYVKKVKEKMTILKLLP